MDSLTALINKASEAKVISNFHGISPVQRLSIYVDDLALFIKPSVQDLHFVRLAFNIFGEASGLRINYRKSSATLIRGDASDRTRVQTMLQCNLGNFPCRYLGLQLAIHKLTRVDWQPLLDKVRKVIPAWQRGFIQRPGRLILVKSVIAARPIHQLMILNPPSWVLEEINRWMRSFFWAGKDKVNGGQCLVAWDTVCSPTRFGGLGVKDLNLQAIALRVRWEWLHRTDSNRPWQGLNVMVDRDMRGVFDSLVKITVGNGSKVLFWTDRWIHGAAVTDIAPLLV